MFPARTQDIRRPGRAQVRRIKIPLPVQHLRKRKDELAVERSVCFHFRHARDILPEIVYALPLRRCEHAHGRDTLDVAHIFARLGDKPLLGIGDGARRERLARREKIVLLAVVQTRAADKALLRTPRSVRCQRFAYAIALHEELRERGGAFAVQAGSSLPAQTAAIPALRNGDAQDVLPFGKQRRNIVLLHLQTAAVRRPAGRKPRAAHALSVELGSVQPQRRRTQARGYGTEPAGKTLFEDEYAAILRNAHKFSVYFHEFISFFRRAFL